MGLETPYVPDPPDPPPPDPDFPYLEAAEFFPTYVNGRQVTATVNGIRVPWAMAMGMLGHSADIDFANTDLSVLGQLGIVAYRLPDLTVNASGGTGDEGDPIQMGGISTGSWRYSFSGLSLLEPQHTRPHGPSLTPLKHRSDMRFWIFLNLQAKMLDDLGWIK
jgi:hypothetical protein